MFEELKGEFSKNEFPAESKVLLEPNDPEGKEMEYNHELEYPYGKLTIKLMQAIKARKDEEQTFQPIPADEEEFFVHMFCP